MIIDMRTSTLLLVSLLLGCGSSATPNDGGSGTDAAADSGSGGNDGGSSGDADAGPPATNIGAPCDTSGADPKCGTDPKATCNDETQDGFPGGYCSYEPCSTTQMCPTGSSCAHLGGEPSACWKNCNTNSDCQNRPNGMAYECLTVDPLFTSGTSHKVCYLKAFACSTAQDCPAVKPTCPTDAGVCK